MINNDSQSRKKLQFLYQIRWLTFQFLQVSSCFLVLYCACRVLRGLFGPAAISRNKPGEEIQISITTDRLQTAGLVSDTSWSLYVCLSCVDSLHFCLSAGLPLLSCVCACGENYSSSCLVPVSVETHFSVWVCACSGIQEPFCPLF